MQFKETPLAGAYIIEPRVHRDHRGFFLESYKESVFQAKGLNLRFVQDNHARSEERGVLRGLHFQKQPFAQTKLVRAIRGKIYDVIVDIRRKSPTYGQSFGIELSEENFLMLLVPVGFAHGYCTITVESEVTYKVDAPYSPQCEGGILWNDPKLKIQWPVSNPILSAKDSQLPLLQQLQSPFEE